MGEVPLEGTIFLYRGGSSVTPSKNTALNALTSDGVSTPEEKITVKLQFKILKIK